MDLVALASSGQSGQVVVQRSIKWERLFGSSCNVSCLRWRPDGKALAVGQEDGHIALYDVESGHEFDLPQSARPHKHEVASMYWAVEEKSDKTGAEEGMTYSDRAALLPHVRKLASADGRGKGVLGSTASALMDMPLFGVENTPRNSLEVLVSGDTAGVVTLSAFGYYPVGCIDLSGACHGRASDAPITVTHLCLSEDLRMLCALVSCEGVGMRLVSVDTSILADYSNELRHVASQYGHISEQIANVQSAIQRLAKEWADGTAALRKHIEPLEHQLRCFERPNTPEQELFMMLTCGVTSAALQTYIADLQEQGLQRLAKTLDSMCATMEDIATHTLYHAAQALVFRLHDMEGLAEWTERFHALGLRRPALKALLAAAQQLVLKVLETLAWVRDARANFAAFTVWLQTVWRKSQTQKAGAAAARQGGAAAASAAAAAATTRKHLAHVDSDRLVRLLSSKLLHPHISEQFRAAPLTVSSEGPAPWTSATQSATGDRDGTTPNASLQQSCKKLAELWSSAFHTTSETVSQSFRPVGNSELPDVTKRAVDVRFHESRFLVAIAKPPLDSAPLALEVKVQHVDDVHAMRKVDVLLPQVKDIHDVQFYSDDSVLLTFTDTNGVRSLGQVDIAQINDPGADEPHMAKVRALNPPVRSIISTSKAEAELELKLKLS